MTKKKCNIGKMLLIALVLVTGVFFAGKGTTVQAAGTYSAYISMPKQTAWAGTAATISWTLNSEYNGTTAGYKIYAGVEYDQLKFVGQTPSTSYTIKNLKPGTYYYVKVIPYSTTGVTVTYGSSTHVETIPTSVPNFKQSCWWYFIEKVDVSWDRIETADQIVVTQYNSKGKKVRSQTLGGSATYASFNVKNTEVYTISVQAFKTAGGKKYSTAVSKIQCFTQARIKSAKVKNKKLTISWAKVNGATGYDVYVSTSKTKGYKKVKSVGKGTSKVTISKFKGKKYNPKKTYYVYVETKKKNGNKTNKSGRLYYWNTKNTGTGYF